MRLTVSFSALIFSTSVWAAEVRRADVPMPGNDRFGFFQSTGYCRLRIQLLCKLPLGSQKLRNQITEIKIKSNFLRHRSDDNGVFDVKFGCKPDVLGETVKLLTAQHEEMFKLSEAPKEIKIPERSCNVDVRF